MHTKDVCNSKDDCKKWQVPSYAKKRLANVGFLGVGCRISTLRARTFGYSWWMTAGGCKLQQSAAIAK